MLRSDPEFAKQRAELEAKIADAEKPVQVLKDQLHALLHAATEHADGLLYSATTRCKCGAGLAYFEQQERTPAGQGLEKSWVCAKALLGVAADPNWKDEVKHDVYPWMMYEIKSERQPSANGRTTRPGKYTRREFVGKRTNDQYGLLRCADCMEDICNCKCPGNIKEVEFEQ